MGRSHVWGTLSLPGEWQSTVARWMLLEGGLPPCHCGGPRFPGVHGLLLPVHPKVCVGGLAPAQAGVQEGAGGEWPSPGVAGVSSHLMTRSICALYHLFLPVPILGGHSSSILVLVGLAWGLSSIRLVMLDWCCHGLFQWGLAGAEAHCPTHGLEFLALKWAMVEKFHEYLYGFMYTDNGPLTYMLMMAWLEATNH